MMLAFDATDADVAELTSIDLDVQRLAQEVIRDRMPDTGGRFVAAVAVVDVQSDSVIAYATSGASQLPPLTTLRPSGSTLKFVVAVAAGLAGAHAGDGVYAGVRCRFVDGAIAREDLAAPIKSLADSAALSSNCAFGKLAGSVGADRLAATVRALGFERELATTSDFGFGANSVSMLELARAMSTVVNGGHTSEASLLRASGSDRDEPSLRSEGLAHAIHILEGVLQDGTAAGWGLDDRWAIAKTGTTTGSTDAWIVGATSRFTTVVWVGNPADPSDRMADGTVPGYQSVVGGTLPASIWHDVMRWLHRGIAPEVEPPTAQMDREPVIVVDPSVDCLNMPGAIRSGSPGPNLPWIETGDAARC